jgi:anti-sigma regulatory factor (Ser/Thr protein kinase)
VLALRRASAAHPARSVAASEVQLRYPSEPAAAGPLRRDLRRVLGEAGVPVDAADDLLLAASEAFNNAVEHAHNPRRPEIEVSVVVRGGDVVLRVRDHGEWRPRRSSMDRGHGSSLMSAAGQVHIGPGPDGTVVTIQRRLSP